MRALQITSFAHPRDAIELVEIDEIEPGPGEVAVEMVAAPINPSDLLLILGHYGVRPPLPAIGGAEGIGEVVALGEGVSSAGVGDLVMVLPTLATGTWTDRVVVPAEHAIPLPDSADPLQLAMLGINPITAELLLSSFVTLSPGDWVAQTTANSAVGRYVIQLAARAGVRTLNVVRRPDAVAPLLELGADAVLVSGPDLPKQAREALGSDRAALMLDAVAGDTALALSSVVRDGATIVSYGGVGPDPLPIAITDLIFRKVVVRGFWLVHWMRETPPAQIAETYDRVAALIVNGTLSAPIAATYPLERYAEALAHAAQGQRDGKVLFARNGG